MVNFLKLVDLLCRPKEKQRDEIKNKIVLIIIPRNVPGVPHVVIFYKIDDKIL